MKRSALETLALVTANLTIIISSFLLFENLTPVPFPGEQSAVHLFYVLGFFGVVMDLFFIFRQKENTPEGLKPPKVLLSLFILIHLVVNSWMIYRIKVLMQL